MLVNVRHIFINLLILALGFTSTLSHASTRLDNNFENTQNRTPVNLLISPSPENAANENVKTISPQLPHRLMAQYQFNFDKAAPKKEKTISAKKAKKIARKKVKDGEVVDVSLKKNVYKVRLIANEGRVVDVFIDARTGKIKE